MAKKIIINKTKQISPETECSREIEEIRIDQTPTQDKWNYKPLYRKTLNDGIMFWQIGFDGTKLITVYGHDGGKMQTVETEIEIKSGKTLQGQALINARRKCLDKIKEGYVQSGSNAVAETTGMKGPDYNPKSIYFWPNYVSRKVDGIRLLVHRVANPNGFSLVMKTYGNRVYTHLKHIEKDLIDYFNYLPDGATLDGELYNHELEFNSITSPVKSVVNISPDIIHIQYWIFDINYHDPDGAPYEKRYQTLIDSYQLYCDDLKIEFQAKVIKDQEIAQQTSGKKIIMRKKFNPPPTFRILESELVHGHDEEDLAARYGDVENDDGQREFSSLDERKKYTTVTEKHEQYVAEGYEGIMIKKASIGIPKGHKEYDHTLYVNGRRNNIMKWKYTADMEVEVIGVKDCKGKEKGSAKLLVRDDKGNEFPVRFGNTEEKREWLSDPDLVIGRILTVKYKELSQYGIPREPVGKAWRDYE